MTDSLAVYVHWPFCASKCPYCDFASGLRPASFDEAAWAAAYEAEIAAFARRLPQRSIGSIYIGGGTPSLMAPRTAARILEACARGWTVESSCEITLEANPSSAETQKLADFRAAGVGRLSLGVQALDDAALKFLGRAHDAAQARAAMDAAARLFERWALDLIYGFAGHTPEAWAATLDQALAFDPPHLSAYQLTIEEGTPFHKRARTEPLCVDEAMAELLFDLTQEKLSAAGRPAYEVSNHAKAGQESRHNKTYWAYGDYIGIGPGAHGRFVENGARVASENSVRREEWRRSVEEGAEGHRLETRLSFEQAMREAVMMGLRCTQGLDAQRWGALFGRPLEAFLPPERLAKLAEEGLLDVGQSGVGATPKGRKLLNALLYFLLGGDEIAP